MRSNSVLILFVFSVNIWKSIFSFRPIPANLSINHDYVLSKSFTVNQTYMRGEKSGRPLNYHYEDDYKWGYKVHAIQWRRLECNHERYMFEISKCHRFAMYNTSLYFLCFNYYLRVVNMTYEDEQTSSMNSWGPNLLVKYDRIEWAHYRENEIIPLLHHINPDIFLSIYRSDNLT